MRRERKRVLPNEPSEKYWSEAWEKSEYTIEEKIDKDRWHGLVYSKQLPYILKLTPKGSKIFEAGCGLDQWVIYLRSVGYDITGVDYSEKTIARLREIYPQEKFEVGNILDLKYSDQTFDAVLSWGVVEHIREGPQEALRESYRILRKNGMLYITVPAHRMLQTFLCPLVGIKRFLRKNGP